MLKHTLQLEEFYKEENDREHEHGKVRVRAFQQVGDRRQKEKQRYPDPFVDR